MRTVKDIIAETETHNLSPIQVGNLLIELSHHHGEIMKTLDEALHLQAVQIALLVNQGKSMAISKAMVEGTDLGKTVRAAKTDLAYIEEVISALKYLARGIEKEYSYAS